MWRLRPKTKRKEVITFKQHYVKANTKTTLQIDYKYMPVRMLTAAEVFAAIMRERIEFHNGKFVVNTPFTVLSCEFTDEGRSYNYYDGLSWLESRDVLLSRDALPVIRTGRHAYPVPTILKVNTIHKAPKNERKLKKPSFRELLRKHDYTCALTGRRFDPELYDPEDVFNKDHIIPKSKGGTNTEENIVLSTIKANSDKGDKYPYFGPDGEEIKAIISHDHFPHLNLSGVDYRTEWDPFLFQDC
jgi:5-methylcytosine-specific restriction endonuclease McrA